MWTGTAVSLINVPNWVLVLCALYFVIVFLLWLRDQVFPPQPPADGPMLAARLDRRGGRTLLMVTNDSKRYAFDVRFEPVAVRHFRYLGRKIASIRPGESEYVIFDETVYKHRDFDLDEALTGDIGKGALPLRVRWTDDKREQFSARYEIRYERSVGGLSVADPDRVLEPTFIARAKAALAR